MESLFRALPPLALALLLCLILGQVLLRFGMMRLPEHPRRARPGKTGGHRIHPLPCGGAFSLPSLRRMGPRIGILSATEILITEALVAGAIFLATGEPVFALIGTLLATS